MYELLRDLLMVWEFFEANSPMICMDADEVVRKRELFEKCEAWLRQIIALRNLMSQDLRIESIKMENTEDKFETMNYIQIIS